MIARLLARWPLAWRSTLDDERFRSELLEKERDAYLRLIANLRYRLRILRAARAELARP